MKGQKMKIVVLPIRPYTQVNNYECGLACTQSLLDYAGHSASRLRLKKTLGTKRDIGTPPIAIKRSLKLKDVRFREKQNSTIKELERQIDMGRVALVAYQAWGSKKYFETLQSGHYSVVFGYKKDYLWLMDPNVRGGRIRYRKGVRKIKKEAFLSRWKDEDYKKKVFDRWFLSVGK